MPSFPLIAIESTRSHVDAMAAAMADLTGRSVFSWRRSFTGHWARCGSTS
jgi:hypothetical protein